MDQVKKTLLNIEEINKIGCEWWALKFIRELDDLILLLRDK